MHLKNRLLLVHALCAFCLTACSDHERGKTPAQPVGAERGVSQTTQRREVIFFAPSSTELADLSETVNGRILDEAVSEFDGYVQAFMENPGRTDLQIRYASDIQLIVPTAQGNRTIPRDEGIPYGVIFTNYRDEPEVIRGSLADADYRIRCNRYFGAPKQ
jgi:hypothetical protein